MTAPKAGRKEKRVPERVRLNAMHSDRVRAQIQTGSIIARLTSHINGQDGASLDGRDMAKLLRDLPADPSAEDLTNLAKSINEITARRTMSATQVTAGLGLLKKVLPDLSNIELTTEDTVSYLVIAPAEIKDPIAWAKQHARLPK